MKYAPVLAFFLVAGPALGQSLPSFSIEKHCQAAGSGYDYCVQRTQGIFEHLQQRWDTIPPEIRGRCLQWLKTSGNADSYYHLEGCVLNSMMPPPAYGYAPPPWYYRY